MSRTGESPGPLAEAEARSSLLKQRLLPAFSQSRGVQVYPTMRARVVYTRLVVTVVGVLLTAGCMVPATGASELAGTSVNSTSTPADEFSVDAVADPVAITIPAIDVHSELTALGLTTDCDGGPSPCLQTPPVDKPELAGWYAGKDPAFDGDEWQPGEVGPAVIAGHVDGLYPDGRKGKPGVFARLRELSAGDEILIDRAAGQPQLRFVVTNVTRHAKADFPTQRVYEEPVQRPELRLITCGGAFDRGSGHYVDNWIVWAKLKA